MGIVEEVMHVFGHEFPVSYISTCLCPKFIHLSLNIRENRCANDL